jgi:hypothetical protein
VRRSKGGYSLRVRFPSPLFLRATIPLHWHAYIRAHAHVDHHTRSRPIVRVMYIHATRSRAFETGGMLTNRFTTGPARSYPHMGTLVLVRTSTALALASQSATGHARLVRLTVRTMYVHGCTGPGKKHAACMQCSCFTHVHVHTRICTLAFSPSMPRARTCFFFDVVFRLLRLTPRGVDLSTMSALPRPACPRASRPAATRITRPSFRDSRPPKVAERGRHYVSRTCST